MSGKERRISPRKDCVVPLRFRVLTVVVNSQTEGIAVNFHAQVPVAPVQSATLEGETLNLSERGLYFTSPAKLTVGAPLEMYFTLPRELTGRGPEPVRCSARVVHVEDSADRKGLKGIGAVVERFEPLASARNWSN